MYDKSTVYYVFGLSALVLLCSAIGIYNSLPEIHKKTLLQSITLKKHIETYIWNEQQWTTDHKDRELVDRDGIRAMIPVWWHIDYCPKDKLITLYSNNWNSWMENPPEWFDQEFISKVPKELLTFL